MTAAHFSRILEDEDTQWCGYCMGIILVFAVAVYAFLILVVNLKN